MPKRVVLLLPDGTQRELPITPDWDALSTLVGGYPEQVKVLDHVEPNGRMVYTAMYVNETSLNDGLPRNQQATEVYQRNVRVAYAGHPHPFRANKEDWLASLPAGTTVEILDPQIPGYADDPWICGPAVLFEGWTLQEVSKMWNGEG